MSRYTEEDLRGLTKAALLLLISRQPNVSIPRRFTTQTPSSLKKEKLRKLLLAPFGFVKDGLVGSLEQGSDNVIMIEQTGIAQEVKLREPPETIQDDVFVGEQMVHAEQNEISGLNDQIPGDVPMLQLTGLTTQPLVETLGLPMTATAANMSENTANHMEFFSNNDLTQASSASVNDSLVNHISIDFNTNRNSHFDEFDTSAYRPITDTTMTLSNNAVGVSNVVKQELNSLIRMETECEPTDGLPAGLQAIVATLPPDVSTMVREYFLSQPQDVKAWQAIESARKKKKPDFAVVRYSCQVLTLHDKLKSYQWPNDTGTLRFKDLARVLGFSSAWFTNARHILKEYDSIGPESGKANTAVIARFQQRTANKKGSDLLGFLRSQRKIIERGIM